MKVLFKSKGSY